ncbi:hypothetical protein SAMN05444158_6305 [Bradyrhizobium canariense]|uniref:Uncharacterized protein n=2 Tax=Bradyrhizobium canariense TaxID=255045 RepID=A0A1H2AN18_9BRAD|nr:hypothetical protein SAMN05444158_6305 [Bradyrhizobium canariense]
MEFFGGTGAGLKVSGRYRADFERQLDLKRYPHVTLISCVTGRTQDNDRYNMFYIFYVSLGTEALALKPWR